MNPWVVIRREIDGAVRSLRYDLANRRAKRPAPGAEAQRRRVILATTAGLAVAGSVSGYVVLTGGLDSLLDRGDAPAALPTSQAKPSATSPPTPAAVTPTGVPPAKIPMALTSPFPSRSSQPSISPPVPTPAPTCSCVTPSPSGSASVSPSPSASPSPVPSPSSTGLTTAPASAATR